MSNFNRVNLSTNPSQPSATLSVPNVNALPTQHGNVLSPAQPLTMQQQQQLPQQQQQRQLLPQQQQQRFAYTQQPPNFTHYQPPHSMISPSLNQTQGVYTSYPARLLQSEDNALLLPSSYLNNKRTRFNGGDGDDSDDEFGEGNTDTGSRTATLRATTRSRNAKDATPGDDDSTSIEPKTTPVTIGAVKEFMNLPRSLRLKTHVNPDQQELDRAASMKEVLVPIRLDIDVDDVKLRDVFLWNMNEQFLTPEKFAEMLCQDIGLEPYRYVSLIAESIRTQVMDFETIYDIELPMENYIRVAINLDLQVGKVNLRDRFEWDLNNTSTNAPEVFSRQLAAELGVGGEYVTIISHAIREQLYRHKRQMVDDYVTDGGITEPLSSAYRNLETANAWTPQMEILSNEELEKLLIAQERNIRRLRRENRFKRSRRRGSLPRRQSGSNVGTPS
ncbi:hypothetical protein BCR42DRAFT_362993 [Absidia repens]|uniref:SNF5-domain-containing protein n=1 Tax=Absidia repens TaxID=90262 RepID=A0A1X2IZR2_9FUNG|nr:hypothetical protein BCR42DRAFT_362993 [Absidia repens]